MSVGGVAGIAGGLWFPSVASMHWGNRHFSRLSLSVLGSSVDILSVHWWVCTGDNVEDFVFLVFGLGF